MKTKNNLDNIYVISEDEYDYNDEYYYPSGGGMPVGFLTSLLEAKTYALYLNMQACIKDDYRAGMEVEGSETYQYRYEWFYKEYLEEDVPDLEWNDSSINIATFPMDLLQAWCTNNNYDIYSYIPQIYYVTKVKYCEN